MAEKKFVVQKKKINFEGYFSVGELYYIIEDVCKRLGYDKIENKHEVRVYKTHREIELSLAPEITVSEYIKHIIEIDIKMKNIKDVPVTIDSIQKTVQEGRIEIAFNGVQISNQEGQWTSKPFNYFMRVLIDKFIYPDFLGDLSDRLKSHVETVMSEVSAHLNMTRFKFSEAQVKIKKE